MNQIKLFIKLIVTVFILVGISFQSSNADTLKANIMNTNFRSWGEVRQYNNHSGEVSYIDRYDVTSNTPVRGHAEGGNFFGTADSETYGFGLYTFAGGSSDMEPFSYHFLAYSEIDFVFQPVNQQDQLTISCFQIGYAGFNVLIEDVTTGLKVTEFSVSSEWNWWDALEEVERGNGADFMINNIFSPDHIYHMNLYGASETWCDGASGDAYIEVDLMKSISEPDSLLLLVTGMAIIMVLFRRQQKSLILGQFV